MGAFTPRWVVVDELVRDLASLRAVAHDVESQALAEGHLALEFRASLTRATDAIHLVIGGDEGMIAQARRTVADAQEVSARAREAVARCRASQAQAQTLRGRLAAEVRRLRSQGQDLDSVREAARRIRTDRDTGN